MNRHSRRFAFLMVLFVAPALLGSGKNSYAGELAGKNPETPSVFEMDIAGTEQPAAGASPDPLVLRVAEGGFRLDWLYQVGNEGDGTSHTVPGAALVPFTNHRVSLNPFPGRRFDLHLSTLYEPIFGVYTFTGTVVDDPSSFAVLTIKNGSVEGKIDAFGSNYVIETISPANNPTGKARVRVLELDPSFLHSSLGRDLNLPGPPRDKNSAASGKKAGVMAKATGSGSKATVLILYTPSVGQERDMDSFSSSIISSVNNSLSTAFVGKSALFAGAVQVSLTESHVCTEMNHLLNRTDGVLDNIDTLMTNYGADSAVLLVDDDLIGNGDCVVPDWPEGGFVEQNFSPRGMARRFDAANRFAVSQDDFALGDYTFGHELGHVWGGGHAAFDANQNGNVGDDGHGHYTYSRAWHDGTNWMTMMGAYEMCQPGQFCLPRLNRFSNPSQSNCSGLPCGRPIGQPDESDMRQSLRDDWYTIRTWAADPAVPGSPRNVNVEPLLCYGSNTVTWNKPSSGGAVAEYEVYRASDSSFSPQYLVYNGSDTYVNLSITSSQSPSYIRVRACNAGGCSGYANGDQTATYTNSCL